MDDSDDGDDNACDDDESEYMDSEEDDGEMHLDMSKIPKDLLGDEKKNYESDNEDVDNFTTSNIASEKSKGEATRHQLGTFI